MNIKMQCCGIIIVALLIILYSRRRKLPLLTRKVFHACLYVTLVCLIFDVASIFGIVYRESLPAFLPVFLCKTYIAFLVLVAYMSVLYVATSVSFYLPHYKKMIIACTVFCGIVIGLIYALPIVMHEDVANDLAWTTGPSTIVTYVGAFVFIVFNHIQIVYHKQYIYERQRKTVLIWLIMWIVAAGIQMMNNQLLVVGFACALSVMIIVIQFENPELYLDRGTGLFNYMAYQHYVEQLYSSNKEFYVMAVTFENAPGQDDVQLSDHRIEAAKVYNTFLSIAKAYVFKIQEDEILILFENKEYAEAAKESLMAWIEREDVEILPSHPAFYYVEDPRCVNSPRELLELIRYVNQQKSSFNENNLRVIGSDTAAQIVEENAIRQLITDALNEDRIIVYYQPIYSMEKKRFTSAEALVRIVDRDGNLIMPGSFIKAAENNGMIIEIGKRVFEKVCQFYKQNKLEEYGIEYVEVNLSVVQCVNGKLADDYIGIMETAQIEPRCINLEITESTSPHGKRTMIANIDRMINYGVNFSLDDFGTGASNLNYIVDMPVQIVKFDRGMIQAYFSSGKAKYVMDAAMHMIHGMGLKIVAEGVETEEQYQKMEEIKINFIQGYYFSKPLPEQEFLKFINQARVEV